jgi:hypothetical protein
MGIILGMILAFLMTACKPTSTICPETSGTHLWLEGPPESLPTTTPIAAPSQIMMKIGGNTIPIDKFVEGPLCNDAWSGTVYVSCNIQVYQWEEDPLFLEKCNLKIEPGTVVYVAHHNNAAYYNGCSCHTNELIEH